MAERNIEIKVGILVAICLGLLITFIIVLGDISSSSGARIYLDVDTSATLKTGAPVKVAGVPAGKVTEVDYHGGARDADSGRPVFVRVTLAIKPEMLATLRRDTRFYITNQGVLGEKYVEIEPVSTEGPALVEGDIVVGEPPLRLEIMAMNANRVLASLSNVLRKNEKALDEMIVNAADTMATVKRTVERVDSLLAAATPKVDAVLGKAEEVEDEVLVALAGVNAAIGDGSELKALVGNASGLAADARRQLAPISDEAKRAIQRYASLGDKAEAMLGEIRGELTTAMTTVNGVLADAKTLTQRLKDGQGTIGAFMSDREMYDDIREMMKDLKRHPWKFIWKE